MRLNPVPEVKKGFCFLFLIITWLVYLFFEPFSALMTAVFLVAALIIFFKEFK